MFNDMTRSRLLQIWFTAAAVVVVAAFVLGASITMATGAILLALCLVPPAIVLKLWPDVPTQTIALVRQSRFNIVVSCLNADLNMRRLRTVLVFLLLLSASVQTLGTCRPVVAGWTEIEYSDLMSGRHGIDREPVFVALECGRHSAFVATSHEGP